MSGDAGRLETRRRLETPGRLIFFGIKHNASQFESVWPDRSQWSLLDPEPGEGISFSSSPDFSTKNVRVCEKYVSI